MKKRFGVTFGFNEIKALESIEKQFPEWEFKIDGDKFKDIFWLGIRTAKEKEQNAVYEISSCEQSCLFEFNKDFRLFDMSSLNISY